MFVIGVFLGDTYYSTYKLETDGTCHEYTDEDKVFTFAYIASIYNAAAGANTWLIALGESCTSLTEEDSNYYNDNDCFTALVNGIQLSARFTQSPYTPSNTVGSSFNIASLAMIGGGALVVAALVGGLLWGVRSGKVSCPCAPCAAKVEPQMQMDAMSTGRVQGQASLQYRNLEEATG